MDTATTTELVPISLAGLDKKQISALKSLRKDELLYQTLQKTGGGVKDILVALLKAIEGNDLAQIVALYILVDVLTNAKVLGSLSAGFIKSLIVTKFAIGSILPWD